MITQTNTYVKNVSKTTTVGSGRSGNGCGCNDSKSHCTSSPVCDATCGCSEGQMVQPIFSAGQLLTDDDLQALTNYVVTKHRLHNRFVVGSGVSCGLAVTCHPCGQGKVIVQPGYAIDCCGRDIMVPCPVELDINAMVRDLKFKRLGHDCGDPCPDSAKKTKGKKEKREDSDDPADRYCLYLLYCEELTDPVASYSQDESCSATCQPTRLNEGFHFELRCPEEDEPPPSFLDRIRCCIGDFEEADLQSKEFEHCQSHVQRAKWAMEAISQKKEAGCTKNDEMHILELKPEQYDPLRKPPPKGPLQGKDENMLFQFLDDIQYVGPCMTRFVLLPDKKNFKKKEKELENQIIAMQELVNNVKGPIVEWVNKIPSSVQKAQAFAILEECNKYAVLKLDKSKEAQAKLYGQGYFSSRLLASVTNKTLANYKDWLLRKMCHCPPITDCFLIEEVKSVVIPVGDCIDEATVDACEKLYRAVNRYLLDCICSALIPPCPTCDDPAVKLACLEVIDCEVDTICNLERTFLLTEHNLRYWLPFLNAFGEALERLCCESSKKCDKPTNAVPEEPIGLEIHEESNSVTPWGKPRASRYQFSTYLKSQPMFATILRLTGLSTDPTINLILRKVLIDIARCQPQTAGLFMETGKTEAVWNVGEGVMYKELEPKRVQTGIKEVVKTEVSAIRQKIESYMKDYRKENTTIKNSISTLKKADDAKKDEIKTLKGQIKSLTQKLDEQIKKEPKK